MYIEVHQKQEAFLQIAAHLFSKSVYTCTTLNTTLNKSGAVMASFVNMPQSKVTWKESLNEDCLNHVDQWACLWEIFVIEQIQKGRPT